MWDFYGVVECECNFCGEEEEFLIDDFDISCVASSERNMGVENVYSLNYDFNCQNCAQNILLAFEVVEYPTDTHCFTVNNSHGCKTVGEPSFRHLEEIYQLPEDALPLIGSVKDLIVALQERPYLIGEVEPRQFEEIVGEVFRSKGFDVELTKPTKDGGKDIIAIHTDSLGIKNKYFIECKCYNESNKVTVGFVRSLYGVKNTKDGPNKAVLVTTSTFTQDARKFVENEVTSSWDLELVDRGLFLRWLDEYSG